jgi:hypothetical protein
MSLCLEIDFNKNLRGSFNSSFYKRKNLTDQVIDTNSPIIFIKQINATARGFEATSNSKYENGLKIRNCLFFTLIFNKNYRAYPENSPKNLTKSCFFVPIVKDKSFAGNRQCSKRKPLRGEHKNNNIITGRNLLTDFENIEF